MPMLKKFAAYHDPWSLLVIAVTIVLFFVAVFLKGLTHDVLLESGVFLVSLKLIMMGHKQAVLSDRMEEHLDEILKRLP
jgi:low affinity Fe/Cu permease